MGNTEHSGGEVGQPTTPKVLEIIRTAAADCDAQDNFLARNELLDAAVMVRELMAALKAAEQYVARVASQRPTEPARIQRQRQAIKDLAALRAAITKATGVQT